MYYNGQRYSPSTARARAHRLVQRDRGDDVREARVQRIALGLLSSLAMIRLGRVHAGLMVDVQATNAKLTRRSEAILRQITGREGPEVREALAHAGGQVKLAALVLHGLTPDHAAALLDRSGGHLRSALALLARSSGTEVDAPPSGPDTKPQGT